MGQLETLIEAINQLTEALKANTTVKMIAVPMPPPMPEKLEEPKAVEEKPKKEPKKKKITIEIVRAALNDKAKKDGFNKALEILKDCGADNVTELQEQFYERCVELCQK